MLGFLLGVVPDALARAPGDVSTREDIDFLLVVLVPALLLMTFGAALGAMARGRGTKKAPA
ncbi:MAG TPA: hypothetical protein VFA37_00155 [Gaiellaceae bacterium]|nr:hypothetical protein [Gaiellaceae bacterium]